MTVAALYTLELSSPYREIDDVDLWPQSRDATKYNGPHPVVAHPPCGPWSRSWSHACGPALRAMKPLARIAVGQVRRWGGILEHPRRSLLWEEPDLRLPRPTEPTPEDLRLSCRDEYHGWTVAVELGWWGCSAVKPTWLYCCGIDPAAVKLPARIRPPVTVRARRSDGRRRAAYDEMSSQERKRTPAAMARWLVETVRSGAELAEGER